MSVSEIEARLDGLAEQISADIDAGREPEIGQLEEYGESLCDFLREDAPRFFEWAREVFGRAA